MDTTPTLFTVVPNDPDRPSGADPSPPLPAGVEPLNDLSELYHVLERRLCGAARDWPSHRLAELDAVLRERFADFFADLPAHAVQRLIDISVEGDPYHVAS